MLRKRDCLLAVSGVFIYVCEESTVPTRSLVQNGTLLGRTETNNASDLEQQYGIGNVFDIKLVSSFRKCCETQQSVTEEDSCQTWLR